jgi:Holliday junction DNA helicase RuvB
VFENLLIIGTHGLDQCIIDLGAVAAIINDHIIVKGMILDSFGQAFGADHLFDHGTLEHNFQYIDNQLLNIEIDREGAIEIARRSRGTPRIANRLLRRVRDYAQVSKINKIDAAIASKSLDDLKIDKSGLDELDRKVLKLIINSFDGGPVGIESLAASLNEETDTLVDVVEPFLLKAGYLKRSSRGRLATKLTYEHFDLKYNQDKQKEFK